MSKDNTTDLNEYKNNMSDEESVELPKELLEAYIKNVDDATPDLWNRIEAGFDDEIKNIGSTPHNKNKWKKYMGIAAAMLVVAIAVPVALNIGGMGSKKSDSGFADKYEEKADGTQGDMDVPEFDWDFHINVNKGDTAGEITDNAAESEAGGDESADSVTEAATSDKSESSADCELIVKGAVCRDGEAYHITVEEITDNRTSFDIEPNTVITISNEDYVSKLLDSISYDVTGDNRIIIQLANVQKTDEGIISADVINVLEQ